MNEPKRWSWIWLSMALFVSGLSLAANTMDVTVRGAHLGTVTLDGVEVPFKALDDGALVLTLSPPPTGAPKLVVTTPGGQVEHVLTLPSAQPIPESPLRLSELTPSFGPQTGGSALVILGGGFKRSPRELKVFLGGVQALDVGINSDGRMTVTSPPHGEGRVDLEVRAVDGSVATLKEAFLYVQGPKLSAITPAEGPVAGGSRVVIRGKGFATEGVLGVRFGRAEVKEIGARTAETLEVLVPPFIEGSADVVVTNPDGQSATLPLAFKYLAAPVIRNLDVTPR